MEMVTSRADYRLPNSGGKVTLFVRITLISGMTQVRDMAKSLKMYDSKEFCLESAKIGAKFTEVTAEGFDLFPLGNQVQQIW